MDITDICSDCPSIDRTTNVDNSQWSTVGQNKERRRQNAGSVEIDTLIKVSRDKTLNALFTKVMYIIAKLAIRTIYLFI